MTLFEFVLLKVSNKAKDEDDFLQQGGEAGRTPPETFVPLKFGSKIIEKSA